MAKFLLLNGPNLNLLGTREPELYGDISLEEIEKDLIQNTCQRGHALETFQSNAEHELVERIHQAKNEDIKCLIFNPGAFTHSSISLRDALAGTKIPFIEVHISNIYSREDFRHKSLLTPNCEALICGLGLDSYKAALSTLL